MDGFDDNGTPLPPGLVPVVQPGGGFGGGIEDFLMSGTFFTIFFGVVALLVVAGFVTFIVTLIRGKGKGQRRYVLMEVADDGSMRPAAMPGTNTGMDMHNAAHEQFMQQQLNQQNINQQMFPPNS